MTNTRPFSLGLALGVPLGAGVLFGTLRIVRELRARRQLHEEHIIDGVHPPDPMTEWTLERESSHAVIELESEIPDFSEESQRW